MLKLPPLDVLYEDNHVLAINKPAGLPTMGVAADRPSPAGDCQRIYRSEIRQARKRLFGRIEPAGRPCDGCGGFRPHIESGPPVDVAVCRSHGREIVLGIDSWSD